MSVAKQLALRENATSDFIPYTTHIDEHTLKTEGAYLQIIRLGGISHESADDEDLFSWKDQLNILLRNIASPHLALWTHVVRRKQNTYPQGHYPEGVSQDLNQLYKDKIEATSLMINELYISIVYRPVINRVTKAAAKLNTTRVALEEERAEAIEALHEATGTLYSSMGKYDPHLLGVYEKKGVYFSEALAFLGFLVNGEQQPIPLPKAPIREVLSTSRPFFGSEVTELRGVIDTVYAAALAIKEYPEYTQPGYLDGLLAVPFQIVLTQSYTFLTKQTAVELLKRQQNQKINTGDYAASQIEAIDDALDEVTSGSIVFGVHHSSLFVFAPDRKALTKNLFHARSVLVDTGMVIAREDLALESAFWAQLPGNFALRPRPAPISSKNFIGFTSFHNYPAGRRSRNQWGEAVTMFKTAAGSPYYFNFHEPRDEALLFLENEQQQAGAGESTSNQKALANTVLIGPSGSGKTVLQTFLLAQLQKFNVTNIIYDKDRGQEIFIRSMGGTYLPLLSGERTGFNPFMMQATQKNLIFLQHLIVKLAGRSDRPITARQEREIHEAILGVMGLRIELRRLSALKSFLDPTEENGIYARLDRWCQGGILGWVFDNATDELDFDNSSIFGFDITEFLNDPEVRTPIIMYLFHRTEYLLDGRRLTIFMDEFWKMLEDEYFEDFANNKLKTIRKQDGFLVLGTQSARDVVRSKIAHSIIEQCATMIFLPNPKADPQDYVDGFKLSEREFEIIKKEMLPSSRRFLIKQGHNSVVAELDLKGQVFDDMMALLSGTTDNVLLVNDIINIEGDDPGEWIPVFQDKRRSHL